MIDPDRFLGEGKYLISVLLARRAEWGDEFGVPSFMRRLARGYGANEDTSTSERWRLIVMEDTGELLSADAKERTGQSLSRLLNTVDGLIGQGLRTLILVTTNEPVRELHPAVGRAGRCAAAIEFLPLAADEATTWLGRKFHLPRTEAALNREGFLGNAQAQLVGDCGAFGGDGAFEKPTIRCYCGTATGVATTDE